MKTRIYGLDLVRALAISMVMLSHTTLFFNNIDNVFTKILQILGFYGVEVFFVLSGFLIGNIVLRLFETTSFSFKVIVYFWIRRWFRTLPLYFLILVLNTLLAIGLGYSFPFKFWKYFLFLQNFYNEYLLFFSESWSLSVEEYAYLLGPLVLFVFNKIFFKKRKAFVFTFIFLIVISAILKILYYYSNLNTQQSFLYWNENLKAIVIYRMDAIFIGFILFYFFKKYKSYFEKRKMELFYSGSFLFALLTLSQLIIPINMGYTFYWNVLFLFLVSLSISLTIPMFYYLAPPAKVANRLITNISLYSYSMYLLHYTFMYYLLSYFIDLNTIVFKTSIILIVFYFIVVYFLSKILYTYFEKPIMNLRDSPFIRKSYLE